MDAGGGEECWPTVRGEPDHGAAWSRTWSGHPSDATITGPRRRDHCAAGSPARRRSRSRTRSPGHRAPASCTPCTCSSTSDPRPGCWFPGPRRYGCWTATDRTGAGPTVSTGSGRMTAPRLRAAAGHLQRHRGGRPARAPAQLAVVRPARPHQSAAVAEPPRLARSEPVPVDRDRADAGQGRRPTHRRRPRAGHGRGRPAAPAGRCGSRPCSGPTARSERKRADDPARAGQLIGESRGTASWNTVPHGGGRCWVRTNVGDAGRFTDRQTTWR